MNKELQTSLLSNVENIRTQALENLNRADTLNNTWLFLKKLEAAHLETVLNAQESGKPKYSNDKVRQIALDKLLAEDIEYRQAHENHDTMLHDFKIAQIELDYLRDLFKANLAIAKIIEER